MDIEVGAQVVTADGQALGVLRRREQDYLEVLPPDGEASYWLNMDAVEDTWDGDGAGEHEVRMRFAAADADRYKVRPASAQREAAERADELSPGPVGRKATVGGGGEEDFSSDLASDIAARRGSDESDADTEPDRRED